jgi:hypothetical protein
MSFPTMKKLQMRTLRWALTGVVLVLVSCGGGSSPTSTDAVAEVVYNVGDTGPGGGIIFYVDEAGFNNSSGDDTSIGAMCLIDTCHYLEMAMTDLEGSYSWDDAIVAAEAFSTPSANDWVLPSFDALNEMCKYAFGDTMNRICNDEGNGTFTNSVGGFSPDLYWSSSENVDYGAYVWVFMFGGYTANTKNVMYLVRPVRAF